MDNELRLVSKVVRAKDIKPALERGITADWFANSEAREMWLHIHEHYGRYGVVPEPVTLKNDLPGCTLLAVNESYDYLLDAFCAWRKRGLVIEALQNAAMAMENGDDTEAALSLLSRAVTDVSEVGLSVTLDMDLTKTVDERIEQYLSLRDLPDGLRGIRTGFSVIDEATLGLQPGQLITLVAAPKSGKSTITEVIARNVHGQGEVPLLISFEMPNQEQAGRLDSIYSGVGHRKLMTGRIDARDERRLRRSLGELKDKQPFHLVADPSSVATVSHVAALIEKYRPTAVFIDGVYLMRDEVTGEHNTPQALTNITRALKRLAMRAQVPVFASTQALYAKMKGKSIVANSPGYTSSFVQDSDAVFGLEHIPEYDETDPGSDNNERILRTVLARNSVGTQATIIFDWSEGRFEEYPEL